MGTPEFSPRDVRIASVKIANFRGVSGQLDVSFLSRQGSAVSALISGDNGVGKSTIVEAIEWACQGGARRTSADQKRSRLLNLGSPSRTASAEVVLSTGLALSQSVTFGDEDLVARARTGPRDLFVRAPMILKRFDILRLLETRPIERGVLFIDHSLAEEVASKGRIDPEDAAIADQIRELKYRTRKLAAQLAESLGVDADVSDAVKIDALIRDHARRGFTSEQAKRLNLRLPEEQERLIDQIYEVRREMADLRKSRRRTEKKIMGKAEIGVRQLAELLDGVDAWLTQSFLEVTSASHVRALEVKFAETGVVSIDFSVVLANGKRADPTDLFSEGYQDLIAFLFFLAVLREAARAGQPKVLILDDVFQSVDASIRVSVMNLVAREFADWQLFITVHDRLWQVQVSEIMRATQHPYVDITLGPWSFESGTHVVGEQLDPSSSLRSALAGGDVGTVTAVTGRLLEQVADRMSWTLRTSIQRTRGDRYTLADLWPGVAKSLRRLGLGDQAEDVEKWRHLRNLAGAHFNEWAESVPWSDAQSFATAVLRLFERVFCSHCHTWVSGAAEDLSCRCGETALKRS